VYNLRGTLVAVIDLGKLLGLEPSEHDSSAHIVVGEAGGFAGGLLVDAVQEIMDVPRAEREPPLATLDSATRSYVVGQVQFNGRLVIILDLGRLFQTAVQKYEE
jgi:purine-binding chemotaxis protein CheW